MPLFAVMKKTSAVRIYRIETDQKTDKKITATFKQQLTDFENDYPKILPFAAGYNPDSDECSIINNFIEAAPLLDAVKRSTAIPKWDDSIGLDDVAALFMAPDYPTKKDKIAIQIFSKKQILKSSKYLWLNKNVFSMSELLGFNIDDKLVALVENQSLKFRSFTSLRSIFDMNQYFALATKQDIDDFTKHVSFDVPQGFDMNLVADNVIRKKVALINKSKILDTQPVDKIETAASNLNFPLVTSGVGKLKKIVMPTDKKLIKELLDFLDEDYFNSELTQVRYRSNSKRIA
ncbi:hypothetical protein TH60_17780 [Pantoea ananatis]|uniref:hypothetical protein n=1 Tax=Pantoea ananas TaxID=553 RepID=UPI0023507035|nr:hypothetical protein [Pantoea ananatis]MDC7871343.1 hypothetical protein [Pantoea ananatis]